MTITTEQTQYTSTLNQNSEKDARKPDTHSSEPAQDNYSTTASKQTLSTRNHTPNYSPSNSKTCVKSSDEQKPKQDSTQTYHHYTDYATHSKPPSNQPLHQSTQTIRKCSWDTSTTHNQKHTPTVKSPF